MAAAVAGQALAAANGLADATITTASGLKITPLDAVLPDTAQALIDRAAMLLPRVKITDMLMEVDEWTGFTGHFTHLKTGGCQGSCRIKFVAQAVSCGG